MSRPIINLPVDYYINTYFLMSSDFCLVKWFICFVVVLATMTRSDYPVYKCPLRMIRLHRVNLFGYCYNNALTSFLSSVYVNGLT